MSKGKPNPIREMIADLAERCAPRFEEFLNAHGHMGPTDPEMARQVAAPFIKGDAVAAAFSTDAMALMITEHYVRRTDIDGMTCRQLALMPEEEVRARLDHATHRTGEGRTILQKYMTREQVEGRHMRKVKNGEAVVAGVADSEIFTEAVLRHMDAGLSYPDSVIQFKRELPKED